MNKRMIPALMILAAIAASAAISSAGPADAKKDRGGEASSAKLADLSWMEGTWIRHEGSEILEETWLGPEGDCMIGTFRWIKGGKVAFTEFMTVTVDDGTPVFRLRHFDRKMVPWEEKDAALTYPLGHMSEGEVAFENPQRDKPRRFVYRLKDKDTLVVALEGVKPDGGTTSRGFEFKRRK